LAYRLIWIEAETRWAARSVPDGHRRFDTALVSEPEQEPTSLPVFWFLDPELPS